MINQQDIDTPMDIDIQAPTDQTIPELSTKIVSICEKDFDIEVSASKIAPLILENFAAKDSSAAFLELVHALIKRGDNKNYATITLFSLHWCRHEDSDFEPLFKKLLKEMTHHFHSSQGETYLLKKIKKKFPLYAHIIGESFIQAMGHKESLYGVIAEIYSLLVGTELQQEEDYNLKRLEAYKGLRLPPRTVFIKLYDEIFNYINDRGRFKPETLVQENPYQFIVDLSERLRGTRIYCIQNMVQKFSLEKQKITRRALREKEASAEMLSSTKLSFQKGLKLFYDARTFKHDYMKTEKIRLALRITFIITGIILLASSIWSFPAGDPLKIVISLMFIIGGKFLCGKKIFFRFYPRNIKKELEMNLESCVHLFRKTSLEQINLFLKKQVQEPKNKNLLAMMPDFIKYLFELMPNKKERVMTREQILDTIRQLKKSINLQILKVN